MPPAMLALCLFLLFAGSALLTSAHALVQTGRQTVQTLLSRAPLAVPDAVITSASVPTREDLSALSSLGRGIRGASSDCTIGGRTVRVIGLPAEYLQTALFTEDGEDFPDGPFCAAVPLSGDAPKPGEKLAFPETLISGGTLTVKGAGGNLFSVLSPYLTGEDGLPDCLVYTALENWDPDATCASARVFVLYGDSHKADIAASDRSLSSLAETTESARRSRRRSALHQAEEEKRLARDSEQEAIDAYQAEIVRCGDVLSALAEKIPQAEKALLDADRALSEKRQAFNSDMEYKEYHAVNQTSLIEEKTKAEAEFAVMQADVDAKLDALTRLYAERTAAQDAQQTAAEKAAAAADARAAEKEEENAAVSYAEPDVSWRIAFLSETGGNAAETADPVLLPGARLLSDVRADILRGTVFPAAEGLLFLLLSAGCSLFLFYAYPRPTRVTAVLCTVFAVLCTGIGLLSGISVLCGLLYEGMLPVLSAAVPFESGPIITRGTLLCSAAALLLPFAAVLFGRLLRRRHFDGQQAERSENE